VFVGHLAAGFALKSRVREAPLLALLLGTAVCDLLFGVFGMLGVERAVPHGTPVFANWELHIGYSHSLLVSVLYATALGWLAARWWRSSRIGAAVGLAVFSHFVLDVASHRPDMPLIGLGASHDLEIGTNLALYPLPFFLVELGWCLLAWRWYDPRNRRLLVTLLVMMVIWSNNIFGFSQLPDLTPAAQAGLTLVGFLLFAAVLWWAAQPTERRFARA
jgi:hypothetical protein